jgi:hypothetical protein
MGLSVHAHRPLTYFPPTSGIIPPDKTRAPRVDGVGIAEAGQVNNVPAPALDANIVELGESPNLAARDEYLTVAPGTHPYQWKFGARKGESEHYGYDPLVASVNYYRFNPNSTIHGVNGTAGADPVVKCRQMLLG